MLLWILLATALGSLASLAVAGSFLALPCGTRKKITPDLVAFATGALLAGALVGLIPEAIESFAQVSSFGHDHGGEHHTLLSPASLAMGTILAGMIVFFLLEKFVRIHHCHNHSCESHHESTAHMIVIGDALHNFIDGVVIAASFLVSVPVGIATTIAVAAHEIPQEVGDFGIFLHAGYSRARAIKMNLLSASTALLGAVIGYFALHEVGHVIPYVMAFAAASFLHIALSDLGPELHRENAHPLRHAALMTLGAGVIVVTLLLHHH